MQTVPWLVSLTLAFALQLRKKHGKTSVRVVKECCYPLPKLGNTHTITIPTIHTPTLLQKAPHIDTVQNPHIHTPIHYKTIQNRHSTICMISHWENRWNMTSVSCNVGLVVIRNLYEVPAIGVKNPPLKPIFIQILSIIWKGNTTPDGSNLIVWTFTSTSCVKKAGWIKVARLRL